MDSIVNIGSFFMAKCSKALKIWRKFDIIYITDIVIFIIKKKERRVTLC